MARTYRVGVASMVHDHVWGELRHWAEQPNARLVAAGDENAELREKARDGFGVERLYDSWQQMLEEEELDIVQAASDNRSGADIVEACAARGIHVVSEKPMSATLAQANRMVAAARRAGIRLLINWPTAWSPAVQEMERRILAGEIGQVTYFKQRSAHNGPKEIGCSRYFWEWLYDEERNGAGALMDYCCYSADMCARFLGLPRQVTGFRGVFVKDYPLPDDNAIILMRYPHAFGVAEASWTQTVHYATPNPVAYGTGGSIAIAGSKVIVQRPEGVEEIEPAPLRAPLQSAPQYLIHCLEAGVAVEGFCSMEVSRDAQEILEAGKRAADTGQTMQLPLD
ncbi:MAG: Gfo/Idh/MocA family oxidoreductase [Chthonomonadales bacterium]|nr:Gfo/Idh/MocA family oxidoreductase [Chthonomonadales bacterium]